MRSSNLQAALAAITLGTLAELHGEARLGSVGPTEAGPS